MTSGSRFQPSLLKLSGDCWRVVEIDRPGLEWSGYAIGQGGYVRFEYIGPREALLTHSICKAYMFDRPKQQGRALKDEFGTPYDMRPLARDRWQVRFYYTHSEYRYESSGAKKVDVMPILSRFTNSKAVEWVVPARQ